MSATRFVARIMLVLVLIAVSGFITLAPLRRFGGRAPVHRPPRPCVHSPPPRACRPPRPSTLRFAAPISGHGEPPGRHPRHDRDCRKSRRWHAAARPGARRAAGRRFADPRRRRLRRARFWRDCRRTAGDRLRDAGCAVLPALPARRHAHHALCVVAARLPLRGAARRAARGAAKWPGIARRVRRAPPVL